MSVLERPPTCSSVKYSVQATCTYAKAWSARPVVSSACRTGAMASNCCRWGRNVLISFFAARRRARAVNPVARCNPVNVCIKVVARPIGR